MAFRTGGELLPRWKKTVGTKHIVTQGECLSSIADKYGFESWRTIYEHSSNADLRKARPSPDLLFPGDEVVIPDISVKNEACPTDVRHTFVLKRLRVKLRVILCDDNKKPLANKRYILDADGMERKGQTNADGLVEQQIPASLDLADLLVWLGEDTGKPDLEYTLKLGHLDPIDTTTGVLARLHNLGYRCAASGEETEFDTDAVCAFRQDYGLAEGDQIDDAFRQRLIQEHDGG